MTEPINFDKLNTVTGGDSEFEATLLKLYGATASRCMKRLKPLIDEDAMEQWHVTVHELKGATNNIYAEELSDVCKQIEHLPCDPDERKLAYDLLEKRLTEVLEVINR